MRRPACSARRRAGERRRSRACPGRGCTSRDRRAVKPRLRGLGRDVDDAGAGHLAERRDEGLVAHGAAKLRGGHPSGKKVGRNGRHAATGCPRDPSSRREPHPDLRQPDGLRQPHPHHRGGRARRPRRRQRLGQVVADEDPRRGGEGRLGRAPAQARGEGHLPAAGARVPRGRDRRLRARGGPGAAPRRARPAPRAPAAAGDARARTSCSTSSRRSPTRSSTSAAGTPRTRRRRCSTASA